MRVKSMINYPSTPYQRVATQTELELQVLQLDYWKLYCS